MAVIHLRPRLPGVVLQYAFIDFQCPRVVAAAYQDGALENQVVGIVGFQRQKFLHLGISRFEFLLPRQNDRVLMPRQMKIRRQLQAALK